MEVLAVDIEANSANPREVTAVWCVGYSHNSKEGVLVPPNPYDMQWWHEESENYETYKELKRLLSQYIPIFHNAKYDVVVLERCINEPIERFHDTLVLSYVFYPDLPRVQVAYIEKGKTKTKNSRHSLGAWGKRLGSEKQLIDSEEFSHGYTELMGEYCVQDCRVTYALYTRLLNALSDDKGWECYYDIDLPFVRAVIEMESNTPLLDKEVLRTLGDELKETEERLLREMQELVGDIPSTKKQYVNKLSPEVEREKSLKYEGIGVKTTKGEAREVYEYRVIDTFNPGSPAQFRYAMEKLYGIEKDAKLDKNALTKIAHKYPLAQLMLDYRKVAKLSSTYISPMLSEDYGKETSWNNTLTKTGRLSCSKPNWQNIPGRGEYGEKLRNAVIAREGMKLVGIDMASFQIRIAAYYMHELMPAEPSANLWYDAIQEAGIDEEAFDPHTLTAQMIYGESDKDKRRKAKTGNFGNLFGFGVTTAAASLEISVKEAQSFLDIYNERFPAIKALQKAVHKTCSKRGGIVYSVYGRRGVYPDINNGSFKYKARAQRQAFNFIIQATEADIMKLLCVRAMALRDEKQYDATLLLQVHDEVLWEVREEQAKEWANELTQLFTSNELLPGVLLVGNAMVGSSWGGVH